MTHDEVLEALRYHLYPNPDYFEIVEFIEQLTKEREELLNIIDEMNTQHP